MNIKEKFKKIICKKIKKTMSKNFKIGDKVKVIANTSGNSYVIGKIYTIVYQNGYKFQLADQSGAWGNYINTTEMQHYGQTKEDLLKDLEEKEQEVLDIKARIEFMEDQDFDSFDEDEFKVWRALSSLENPDLSKKEKTKLLAKLLKN